MKAQQQRASKNGILLIEDRSSDARLILELLTESAAERHGVTHVHRLVEALPLLGAMSFKAAIVDVSLPGTQGVEAVTQLRAAAPSLPIVVLAGMDDEPLALRALEVGGQDYLIKGLFDGGLLNRAIRYAVERKESEELLTHLAYYDQLTGLPNRRLFHQRLALDLARARRKESKLTVLCLDLDRFERINDALGYRGGDEVLKEVGKRLAQSVREFETSARLGGDEFAVILQDLEHEQEAMRVTKRLLDRVAQPLTIGGQDIEITASVGIAFFPDNGDTVEHLLKCSDSAMRRAKQDGHHGYQVFSRRMHSELLTRMSLERDLRRALEREEFRVHYQPQLSLDDNQLVAVEALVRWEHAERGLIAPTEFIPLLEDSGLIINAGEWILRTACAQVREWQAGGYEGLRVAVNLSPRQFEDDNLATVVKRALADFDLKPDCLELEITESHLMRDTQRTNGALASMKSLGVRIAIDDFGTGYSSLAYLRSFPIDSLKIDKCFVHDITAVRGDASIAAGIIGLGHKLGLEVIAEGVETEEQLGFLYKEGCDAIQGYHCGHPQPPEVLPARAR